MLRLKRFAPVPYELHEVHDEPSKYHIHDHLDMDLARGLLSSLEHIQRAEASRKDAFDYSINTGRRRVNFKKLINESLFNFKVMNLAYSKIPPNRA